MSDELPDEKYNPAARAAERLAEQPIKKVEPNELSSFKKTIAVVSGKGGVGKSLVTTLLAVALKKKGKHVAILDADITGASIPKGFGLEGMMAYGDGKHIYPVKSSLGIKIVSADFLLSTPEEPIIWRGPLLSSLVRQLYTEVAYGDIDFLLIDMPPGTGDVPLTVFQIIPVDGIIVVTSPQDLVETIVSKAISMARMMEIPILGVIDNMAYLNCPACNERIELYGDPEKVRKTARNNGLDVLLDMPIKPEFAKAVDAGNAEDLDVSFMDDLLRKIS